MPIAKSRPPKKGSKKAAANKAAAAAEANENAAANVKVCVTCNLLNGRINEN